MFTTLFFVLAMCLVQPGAADLFRTSRHLASELIAGYEPSSVVTDQNALDLDQKAMKTQLDTYTNSGFASASNIYTKGGNSKSFAVLTLTSPLTNAVPVGTVVTGSSAGGNAVNGETYEAANAGSTTLKVRYAVGSSQATYSSCQVGGLSQTNTAGCFKASGTLSVGGTTGVGYSYSVETGNQNGRTLQLFSTSSNESMRAGGTGDFYVDFEKFNTYYGAFDFSDKIITASFNANAVTLNGKTFNFTNYELRPRAEVIAKTSAYIGVALYVLKQLEDALYGCFLNTTTPIANQLNALDQAVAFYTGSLEGTAGGSQGFLIYNLANRRCINFKTCGPSGDQNQGTAKVNLAIFTEFTAMKQNLASGNKCQAARANKEAIAKKLFVPMIQGSIRYAYVQSQSSSNVVAEAEGAIFSAAVLPIVHKCNANSAAVIYEEMKPNSGNAANFAAVKSAYESTYNCMGITCADVGLLDGTDLACTTPPVSSPVSSPETSPVSLPVPSPVVAPVLEPCGIFNLNLFCPFSFCGLFGRILGLCNSRGPWTGFP